MDPITIGLLLGGGAGLLKGAANDKKMERHNKYRAEAIKYSPWTGMSDPGELNLPGTMESVLQGGAMGAMTGNLFGGAGAAAPSTASALSSGTPGALGAASGANPAIYGSNLQYANMLGGVDAARGLGASQGGLQFAPYTMLPSSYP